MADDEAKKAKQAEIDRKRAEVRKRMEEASKAKKAKKGFMTPDRKKKLRLLLRKKAAEELKKEQERKAAERRRIIEERCGHPKNIDDAGEEDLAEICEELWKRVYTLEGQKFELERNFRIKVFEISELNSQVNDLRGKFVKPTLKKVSKYENKFAKLQKKAAEFNFRNQLKVVKKKEFTLEEEDKEKKPDWSKKGDEKKGEGEDGETEDEKTEDGLTTEGESVAGDLTDATEDPQSDHEVLEPEPVVEPEPEPQPPSPAPEELWNYLKDTVCSNNPLSVDDLVDKLMTAVTAIPQPLLNSVVKDTIKKQKSLDEGLEGGPPAEGDPAAPTEPTDPASEAPADQAPASTDPAAETPVAETPAAEAPATETPVADPTAAPAADAPPADGAQPEAPAADGAQPEAPTAAAEEAKPAEAAPAESAPEPATA